MRSSKQEIKRVNDELSELQGMLLSTRSEVNKLSEAKKNIQQLHSEAKEETQAALDYIK